LRYRVSALLLVMTATAIAVASRPWLANPRHDFHVTVALFLAWTSLGFSFGRATTRWQSDRFSIWATAATGLLVNWVFWYTLRIATHCLASRDNVIYPMPHELRWLINANESHLLTAIIGIWTVAVVSAAWTKREKLLTVSLAVSLLTWFVVFWYGFIRLAVATEVLD
jgi:hypothetical protein